MSFDLKIRTKILFGGLKISAISPPTRILAITICLARSVLRGVSIPSTEKVRYSAVKDRIPSIFSLSGTFRATIRASYTPKKTLRSVSREKRDNFFEEGEVSEVTQRLPPITVAKKVLTSGFLGLAYVRIASPGKLTELTTITAKNSDF